MRAAVVAGRERAESFLAGGVPLILTTTYDLQLDGLVVQVDGLDLLTLAPPLSYKVHADRVKEVLIELVFLSEFARHHLLRSGAADTTCPRPSSQSAKA